MFGVPLFIEDTEIVVIADAREQSHLWGEGGFSQEGAVTFRYLKDDLPLTTKIGATASYAGSKFKVSNLRIRPGAYVGVITLSPLKRGI